MQSEVRITRDERTEWSFRLDKQPPMDAQQARSWLDEQFVELGCEPLRPTGKLLTAEKVVIIAQDAGSARLDDAEWGLNFARATRAVLGKPVVRINLADMTVSF